MDGLEGKEEEERKRKEARGKGYGRVEGLKMWPGAPNDLKMALQQG